LPHFSPAHDRCGLVSRVASPLRLTLDMGFSNARYLAAALLMITSAACAHSIKSTTAKVDYDPTVDLSKYATFFMLKGNSSGDPTTDQLLIASVETALTGKFWLEVPEGEGQAAVVVHTATNANHTYRSFYDGWGGWHWAGPGGSSDFVEDYKVGTVVVTIFDTGSKRAIWRSFANDAQSDSPRQNAKATDTAVARMFNDFPSGSRMALGQQRMAESRLHTSPAPAQADPAVIFSASPARLILIDGDPLYGQVPGSELQRIINTKPLIVRDVAGMYYLKILDGWMEAYSLDAGWWSVAGVPPDGAEFALEQAVAAHTVDLLARADPGSPDGAPSLANGPAPAIFISTRPAELIVTDGPMVFATIEGTSLQYVANTRADVFMEPTDQELYLLSSGRWFRSWRTDGPWQRVTRGELPADFARIPDGSPKARVVKLAMAGTK
jgi:hypothetical protein